MEISATQRSLLIADYLLHHRQNGGRVQVLEDLEEQLITEVHEVALRFPVEGFLMLLLPFALFYLRLLLGRDLWQHWLHGHGGQLPPTTFVVREAALRRCKARTAQFGLFHAWAAPALYCQFSPAAFFPAKCNWSSVTAVRSRDKPLVGVFLCRRDETGFRISR